jgi:(S)-ureidoglycine aminohydrolase
LPGATSVECIVHAGPQLGANFSQITAEFTAAGTLSPAATQRFLFVLEGELELRNGAASYLLSVGGFAFIPAGLDCSITAIGTAKAALIEKIYNPLPGVPAPEFITGNESSIPELPLMGDPSLRVRSLLPNTDAYDFAVNTMVYDPGAGLSMVEVHVMEHGLLMLEGGGIYRLGDSWYPVEAGDFIWMAPFCPQWFGAIGKKPAKYLIYKDWRRHPLGA